jgi:hypothetical protein
MHGDGAKMKVVLMSEWKDNQPSKHYYVLTLRAVNGSGIAEML